MILLLTLIGRFADDTASLMTPQTSLSDVLVSRPRRACYIAARSIVVVVIVIIVVILELFEFATHTVPIAQ